jgi:hypothetical protein
LLWLASLAEAQQFGLRAQPESASRDEFLRTLDRVSAGHTDNWLEAALVATTGQAAALWALEIAADSVRYPFARRAAALMVLGYTRYRPAIPLLKAMTLSVDASPMLYPFAASALSNYPYPELASFWRHLLHHPKPLVRHYAVFGLAASGEAADTLAIRSVNLPSVYNSDGNVKNGAIERLHRPLQVRDTLTFAAPPTPDARFVPSQAWLRAARGYLCATERCPEETP